MIKRNRNMGKGKLDNGRKQGRKEGQLEKRAI
jgi:hypothetical protein